MMTETQIAGAMYGLQKMTDKHPAVRSILGVLEKSINQHSGRFTGAFMALSLYGVVLALILTSSSIYDFLYRFAKYESRKR